MFTFKVLLHSAILLGLMQIFDVSGKSYIEDLTLTASEKKTLDKFRDLVLSQVDLPQEYMKKDVYLIRWLRAQFYDIYEAKKMLEKNLKWRKELKMDSILTEDWTYYTKNFPTSLEGRDYEGKPILYLNIGGMDVRREVVGGHMNDFMRFVAKVLEEGCGLVRELGEKQGNVSQGILLLNAQGFSLVQHGCLQCIPAILNMVVIYENHYPGCADRVFLINVPNAAQPIIQGARRIIHPETSKILEVYGTNKNVWQKALNRYIPMSELPPELGGTKFYRGLDHDNLDYY